METKFLNISDRVRLQIALEKGDKKAITDVFDEMSRLEIIIKDYEIGIRQINSKYTNKFLKKPKIKF